MEMGRSAKLGLALADRFETKDPRDRVVRASVSRE